jgi:hypothetical protein
MYLIQESTRMNSGRFSLLKPCLVYFRGDQMRATILYFGKNCLLHDFGQMRANDYGPDVI